MQEFQDRQVASEEPSFPARCGQICAELQQAAREYSESIPVDELHENIIRQMAELLDDSPETQILLEEYAAVMSPDALRQHSYNMALKNLTLDEIKKLTEIQRDPLARSALLKQSANMGEMVEFIQEKMLEWFDRVAAREHEIDS